MCTMRVVRKLAAVEFDRNGFVKPGIYLPYVLLISM